uniref:Uncharacterized protein n=1 Tax=Ditylum brightwellii TaxID=49249 RepID=A0A7S4VUZ6_9STRA|mmetsp:Transcript_28162/g.42121  ORF Transcript_28162/g.42121 Transcript_28162/m.42121 type:complete len:375 (+) Transcript_28162:73-1197(+)
MIYRKEILTTVLFFAVVQPFCDAFAGPPSLPLFGLTSQFAKDNNFRPKVLLASEVVDAEFEYVGEDDEMPPPTVGEKKKIKTLIDVSLDMDPEWKDLPVPFIDPDGNNFIDCIMVYMVDFEGETYVLATPREKSAAVCYENEEDGSIVMLDSDDDENIEIFEMAAAKLSKIFDDEVMLKRTPRTLTISGNLDKFTGNWRDELKVAKEQTVDADTLSGLDDDDSFFDEFMKRELGAEYDKIMEEDDDIDDIDKSIMKLFEVPGLGTGANDEEGIKALLDEIESDLKNDAAPSNSGNKVDEVDENSGLRLLTFEGPDGKSYSLLELLQPVVIVGKEDPAVQTRRVLLTKEESDDITPRLESYCQKELEDAGLKLSD